MTTKTALVLVADGTEEMEAVITIDVLVRAGVKVTVANIKPNATAPLQASLPVSADTVTCSRGVRLLPDTHLANLSLTSDLFDVLVVPGGLPGAKAMAESSLVHQWVRSYYNDQVNKDAIVAAICAGPTVLQAAQVGQGVQVTSHPSVKEQLSGYYKYNEGPSVVVDQKHGKKVITSRGPGTAFAFALTIAEHLVGKEVVNQVRGPMMMMHD